MIEKVEVFAVALNAGQQPAGIIRRIKPGAHNRTGFQIDQFIETAVLKPQI